ncbi:MAG: hypothetical protein HKN73_12125 [Gemmatimonadetes bacterium]|nr:hypothetical protein [Gemmatimonadota bacterium]
MKHVWTLYIGALVVLGTGRMVQKIVTDTGGFGSRYGPVILAVILGLAVFGNVLEKPLARRWVWMAVFWLLAVGTAGLSLLAVSVLMEGSFRPAGMILGLLVILVPGQWQLFRYVYRSPSVWGAGV